MKLDKRKRPLKRVASKKDIAIVFLISLLSSILPILLSYFFNPEGFLDNVKTYQFAIFSDFVFFLIFSIIFIHIKRYDIKSTLDYTLVKQLNDSVGLVIDQMDCPVVCCNGKGVLFWFNHAFTEFFEKRKESPIKEGQKLPFEDGNTKLIIKGHTFSCQPISVQSNNGEFFFYRLEDQTSYINLFNRHQAEHPAVIYITIDSLDDYKEIDSEKFIRVKNELDRVLREWVQDAKGFIRSFDDDQYLVLLSSKALEESKKNRFDILDRIRMLNVGDGISLTVSMGISNLDADIQEIEYNASLALDLAEQRGGDQVVIQNGTQIEFFGGKTKPVFKKSNVRSRIMASKLNALICKSTNVVIMGHTAPDFDSLGSCIGIARFAYENKIDFQIVCADTTNVLGEMFALASHIPQFANAFVTKKQAIASIKKGTLLIVCDVNDPLIFDFQDAYKKAQHVAIIDHHIQKTNFESKVQFSYVEATASSTCELVTEMLEYSKCARNVSKEEATLLLAGIMLDTKQFTQNAGPRTFSSAQFLKDHGADLSSSMDLLRMDLQDFEKENALVASASLFKEHILIAYNKDSSNERNIRIIGSRVADRLLQVKGISASFVIVKFQETFYISARSTGELNVQRIMEELHGGGHFDMAAAQLSFIDYAKCRQLLETAIEHEINNTQNTGDEQ